MVAGWGSALLLKYLGRFSLRLRTPKPDPNKPISFSHTYAEQAGDSTGAEKATGSTEARRMHRRSKHFVTLVRDKHVASPKPQTLTGSALAPMAMDEGTPTYSKQTGFNLYLHVLC